MSKQLSILVIDDDRMIRQILQSALSRKNFVVHTAQDGPSGIEIARKEDLLNLDCITVTGNTLGENIAGAESKEFP